MDAGRVDVQRALQRSLQQDVATLRTQLQTALQDNKALRARLRRVLNCVDPKCAVCATCLEAVREPG
jgi:hypothetical protein